MAGWTLTIEYGAGSTTGVPEPGTIGLLATGLIGTALERRRKKAP